MESEGRTKKIEEKRVKGENGGKMEGGGGVGKETEDGGSNKRRDNAEKQA